MEVDFSKQIQELNKDSCDHTICKNELSNIVASILQEKCNKHNEKHESEVSVAQLKNVYLRGSDSYNSTHRVGKTKGQWAMARVNMFLKMNRGEDVSEAYVLSDKDILTQKGKIIRDDLHEFFDFSNLDLNLASLDLIKAGIETWDQDFDCEELFYSEAEKQVIDKPFICEGDSKKYGVYVKNPQTGNSILIKFGDYSMDASDSDPDIRRDFHKNHECESANDKTMPRYWSCKFWNKKAVDTSISSDAVEWDEEEIVSEWGWDDSSFVKEEEISDSAKSLEVDYILEQEYI